MYADSATKMLQAPAPPAHALPKASQQQQQDRGTSNTASSGAGCGTGHLHPEASEPAEAEPGASASSSLGGAYPAAAWQAVRAVAVGGGDGARHLRQRFIYTACYCEENSHRLAPVLVERGLVPSLDDLFVVFISNPSKSVGWRGVAWCAGVRV